MTDELQNLINKITSDLDRIAIEKDSLFNDIKALYSFINKNALWVNSWRGNYVNRVLSKIMIHFDNALQISYEHIEKLHAGVLDLIRYRRI